MNKDKSYTTSFIVDQSPEEVFDAINNVRRWWPEIEGNTDKLGDEWTHRYQDVHRCKIKVVELIPGEKVVWLVLDNHFNFAKDQSEWKDTKIIFDIARKGNKTEVCFTHQGLIPAYECFDMCSNAWNSIISGSLRSVVTTGKG